MDLTSFLDAWFITNYIDNSDLSIIKDRLISESLNNTMESLQRIMKLKIFHFLLNKESCQVANELNYNSKFETKDKREINTMKNYLRQT